MNRKRVLHSLATLLITLSMSAQSHRVSVFPSKVLQEIEGFGASDFSADIVGAAYPEFRKEQAVRWLFDSTFDAEGNPNGIGLNRWRLALGPYQNDPSQPDGFITSDGTYNWDALAGKQWIINRALNYGCEFIDVWSHDRPAVLRKGDFVTQQLPAYANHIATVVDHLVNVKKYPVKYIAPVNEPQYDWDMGVLWTSSYIAQLTRLLSAELVKRNLQVPILLGEASDWGDLWLGGGNRAHNQMAEYFNTASKNYIGDVPMLAKEFAVHSYWTDQNPKTLEEARSKAKAAADSYGVNKLHQTEWSMLSEYDMYTNTHMQKALILARTIYADFFYANVASWTYWEALTGGRDDSRFHLINAEERLSTLGDRKNLWVLGNYSMFVRRGYQRVECTGASSLTDLGALAFVSPDQSKLVVVCTNLAEEDKELEVDLSNFSFDSLEKVEKYVTNELLDLQKSYVSQAVDGAAKIPARSVTTLVYTLTNPTSIKEEGYNYEPCRLYPTLVKDNHFFVQLDDDQLNGTVAVDVVDTNGVVLFATQYRPSGATQRIDLPGLARGTYIVNVKYNNRSSNFRILL